MKLTIPNLLSLLRMGLVPLFIIAMIDGESRKALLIFVVAGVTDALDGLIARLAHQQSLLGAFLDPIADKLLLSSAYIILAIPQLNHGAPIPLWITALVLARDLMIVVMALVMSLAVGVRRFPPSTLSKINTVVQVAAVVLVLVSALWPQVELVATTLVYAVAPLTLASGLDYVIHYERLVQAPPAGEGE